METRAQKSIVECQGRTEWFVLHDNGDIEVYATELRALRSIQKRAKRDNKDLTLTTIEWRNVPEGWTPPQ